MKFYKQLTKIEAINTKYESLMVAGEGMYTEVLYKLVLTSKKLYKIIPLDDRIVSHDIHYTDVELSTFIKFYEETYNAEITIYSITGSRGLMQALGSRETIAAVLNDRHITKSDSPDLHKEPPKFIYGGVFSCLSSSIW